LPRGCCKVRYYGIFSPHCQPRLAQARACFPLPLPPVLLTTPLTDSAPSPSPFPRCPHCRIGTLTLIATLLPQRGRSP
jgi:hypothetical protein